MALRYKEREPQEFVSSYQEFASPNGDGPLIKETLLGGKSYFEYSVPGDCPCHHQERFSSSTPFSGVRYLGYDYYRPEWREEIHSYAGLSMVANRVEVDVPEQDVSRLLSRTNPTKAAVSVPNFIYELKDVPGMLRLDGFKALDSGGRRNHYWQRPANAYLSGTFGWGPLISDLYKILDFQKSVESTLRKLKKAHGDRGYSGKITYGTSTASNHILDDNMIQGRGDRHSVTTVTRWGSVRWKSTSTFPDTEAANKAIALSSVFGLTDPLRVIWEGMPWSWLIDWFGNVGDFISANSNNLFVEPSDVWDHTKYVDHTYDSNVRVHPGRQPWRDNLSPGSGNATTIDYYRRIGAAPSLTATLPVLSSGQVRTATALILQRVRARG